MNEGLDNKMEMRHIRPTAMRELVLKLMMEKSSAISLPELESKLESADKATLYRTLKTFEQNKLIHQINDGSGALKYALCKDSCDCDIEDQHIHFHCSKCNETFCLDDISIPEIMMPKGFIVKGINTVVKGVCANCNNAA
jgi:Fur family ferric uptake transcriptional regulator